MEQVIRTNLINLKPTIRMQTGTKNRIYAIVSFKGEDPIKILACTQSGNKSLEELTKLYETKYKPLSERLKIKIELVELIK